MGTTLFFKAFTINLSIKTICATQEIRNLELLVNFHPSSGLDFINYIKTIINKLSYKGHVTFTREPAQPLLKKTDLLIYNSSGTVFDAISMGVPTLYVGPVNGIDLCKLPYKEKIICRTIENIRAKVVRVLNDTRTNNKRVKSKINMLGHCFSEPSETTWSSIINNKQRT